MILTFPFHATVVPICGPFRFQREVIWRGFRRAQSRKEWERRLGLSDMELYSRQAIDPVVRATAAALLAAALRRAACANGTGSAA